MIVTKKCITAPGLGQYSNAILFTGIAATGSAASFYLNTTFGWQYGAIAAVGFGLADLGFFSISLVVRQASGLKIRLRAMQAVFLSLSLIAAASHLLEIFEQRGNVAAAIAEKIETARKAEADARAELARITETGDAAALQAEHKALTDRVALETSQGGCMKRCREAGDKATALLPRIGAAKRRDELSASLTRATTIVTETPKQSVGGIATLAKLSGASEDAVGSYAVAAIMGGLLLAFLLASMLAEEAGEMWAAIFAQRKAARAAQEARVSRGTAQPLPVVIEDAAEALPATQGRKEQTLLRIQMMAIHSDDGILRMSLRDLSETFSVARATLGDWMRVWAKQGLLSYKTIGNETLITVPEPHRIAA